MEIVWHILLTVCLGSTCLEQDIQWFDSQEECESMLPAYTGLPIDGDWDTVKYECKPIGSLSA
jgi:hypothetical protein